MQAVNIATSKQYLRVLNHLQLSGGPFHWVSCPHYLGEIVIYAGLALLAGQELPLTLLILCWVVSSERCQAAPRLALQPVHLKQPRKHQLNHAQPVHSL